MASSEAASDMPGFTALTEQILVREADKTAVARTRSDAQTVIIYGWGDGQPRHVFKYAEGYRQLFPAAKQVVVLASIAYAMWWRMPRCSQKMTTVIDAAFAQAAPSQRVLIHVMSATGSVFYAATLHAHLSTKASLLPHQLVVFDSAPTVSNSFSMPIRVSHAMARSSTYKSPLLYSVWQKSLAALCLLHAMLLGLARRESVWLSAWRILTTDAGFASTQTLRLYLYSKTDDLVPWRDVELHMAQSATRGWQTRRHLFEGSGHVAHMRLSSHQYWAAVQRAWRRAGHGCRL
ncbi:hypothetical protein CDD81_1800 [Ophiocordyceps australis]|uniref:AB hydrolase-1 domain-containing protein n=1 Tax=Ophiocordyceps australis TaxID=1399860 RepID=A0A2C5XZG5_9HYPO|nr:hypothetical protein CDD81_1800 [Ophiocordyceps australis]